MGVSSTAQHEEHHEMAHHVKIEREDDNKTYWVPIPIHRVEEVTPDNQRNSQPQQQQQQQQPGYSQPSTQQPGTMPAYKPRQKNCQNDEDDIFPRKRRSDLYGEIESRKFLSK